MERDFWFDLNDSEDGASSGVVFIDLAQVGSLVNRVALRQGMEYVVESVELFTNGAAQAAIFRLPEHWPLLNGWEKTFHAWKDQQRDAAREAGLTSTMARYNDFKIFFNDIHAQGGIADNLIPIGYSVTPPATGGYDWMASQVVVPNDGGPGVSAEYYIHALGADNAGANPSKGMIVAYAESRSRPFEDDPNIVDAPSGGLYGEMEDVGNDMSDIVTNMQDANTEPPYLIDNDTADEFYPGGANQGLWTKLGNYDGQLEDVLSVRSGTSSMSSDTTGSFIAPCGLLCIAYQYAGPGTSSPTPPGSVGSCLLRVTLAPGGYKGLLAQSMQEAN